MNWKNLDPKARPRLFVAVGIAAVAFVAAVAWALGGGGSGSERDDDTSLVQTPAMMADEPPPTPSPRAFLTPTVEEDTPAPTDEPTEPPPSSTPRPQATSQPQSAATEEPTAVESEPEDQINCATPLQEVVDQRPAGSHLDLTGCNYSASVTIDKPLTLVGGTYTAPAAGAFEPLVSIEADDVVLADWTFNGGGNPVSVLSASNVTVSGNTFSNQTGPAIAIWGGAHSVRVEGNTITQSKTVKTSPIIARASENCSVRSSGLVIASNVIDQGRGDIGWFGVELKCQDNVTVQGNSITGGKVLVSLPDSNNVMVTGNTLDMRGSPVWGVEVPKANNVTMEGNTIFGDGPGGTDHAVSINSGSLNTVVRNNRVSDVRTVVDTLGSNITVTGNCVVNVQMLLEYEQPAPHTARLVEANEGC